MLDIQNVWLDDNDDLKKSVGTRIDVINDAIAKISVHDTCSNEGSDSAQHFIKEDFQSSY